MRPNRFLLAPAATAAPRRGWALFSKMRDGYNTDSMRLADAKLGRASNYPGGDPVATYEAMRSMTRPRRRNRETGSKDDFLSSSEIEKWMRVKDAARILGISEDRLLNLNAAEVEEAWVRGYSDARFGGQRNEASVAAELLLEYIDSSMYVKRTRRYYEDRIERMRLEVEHELGKNKTWYKYFAMRTMGVMFFGGCIIMTFIVYVTVNMGKDRTEGLADGAIRFVNAVFLRSANREPAPNYLTRYRDTPTEKELDERAGLKLEDGPGAEGALRALRASKENDEKEASFLLSTVVEMNEEKLRVHKKKEEQEQYNQQLAQILNDERKTDSEGPHNSSAGTLVAFESHHSEPQKTSNENSYDEKFLEMEQQRQKIRKDLERKEGEIPAGYRMSLIEFVKYFYEKFPTAARARLAKIMDDDNYGE